MKYSEDYVQVAMRILPLSLVILFFFLEISHAASFNCSVGHVKVEKLICSNSELSALDDQLALAFLWAQLDELKSGTVVAEQRQWLKRRNACNTKDCLMMEYASRIKQLDDGTRTPKSRTDSMTRNSCKSSSDVEMADCIEAGAYDHCDEATSFELWANCGHPYIEVLERRSKRAAQELVLMSRRTQKNAVSPEMFNSSSRLWKKLRETHCNRENDEFRRTYEVHILATVNETSKDGTEPLGQPLSRCMRDFTAT